MSKIKIAELFYSIQGEGRYMGVPSVFLRTFGCNFKCQGFGMPRGVQSTEADELAKQQKITPIKSYNELPLVSTGCDSYASWHPAFKDLSPVLTSDAIAKRIMQIIPHGEWQDEHLVITGGEPLLGWQKSYIDLLSHPKMRSLKEITFETNGTQALTPVFKAFLKDWVQQAENREITFSVSTKLPCSGEKWSEALKPTVVCEYEEVGTTYLKYVVANDQDVLDAESATGAYRHAGFKGHVYLMPIGGVESVYVLNNKSVAKGSSNIQLSKP